MTTADKSTRVRKIVVGVDFTELSERALDTAFSMAFADGMTEVHGLFVHPVTGGASDFDGLPPPLNLGVELEQLRASMENRAKASLRAEGSSRLRAAVAHASVGAAADEIAHFAAAIDADLVIVGTHGRKGFGRLLLGSVAERTVRLCGCPVQVVRAKQHTPGDDEPKVEPVCPECQVRRDATEGVELWCARHAGHHPRAHAYHYQGVSMDAAKPWGFEGA